MLASPSRPADELWTEWIPEVGELPVALIGPVPETLDSARRAGIPVDGLAEEVSEFPSRAGRLAATLADPPEAGGLGALRAGLPARTLFEGPVAVFASTAVGSTGWTVTSPVTASAALDRGPDESSEGSHPVQAPLHREPGDSPARHAREAVHLEALAHLPPHLRLPRPTAQRRPGAAVPHARGAPAESSSLVRRTEHEDPLPTASPPAGALCPKCGSYGSLGPRGVECQACGAEGPRPPGSLRAPSGPGGRTSLPDPAPVRRLAPAAPPGPCRVVEVAGHDQGGARSAHGGGDEPRPTRPRP